MLVGVLSAIMNTDQSAPESRPAAAPKQKSAEELRRDQNLERAVTLAEGLKTRMRNPDSFKLEQVLVMEADALCVTYRAQNGFGGMNREQAVLSGDNKNFVSSTADGFPKAWRQHCAEKTGEDITRLVNVHL